jgi:hypothetical protein
MGFTSISTAADTTFSDVSSLESVRVVNTAFWHEAGGAIPLRWQIFWHWPSMHMIFFL